MKTSHKQILVAAVALAALAIASTDACAQQSEAEIAKATQNPVAALIAVPLQYNYDQQIGPQDDGHENYVNVQPVVPFSANDSWNLISRTIMPVVWQTDVIGPTSQSGIGDTLQSLFFSPKNPTANGWIWGAGPAIYLPTATDRLLGADKGGLGPTAVLLKQENGWTYGALMNHIWSVCGGGKTSISSTYLQPFVSYTTKTYTTYAVNSESTYNWEAKNYSVPFNFMVFQLFKVGHQLIQLQAGARYWADNPDYAAHGWGARFAVNFLFPR